MLEAGADTTIAIQGKTALTLAAEKGHGAVASVLEEAQRLGVDLDLV